MAAELCRTAVVRLAELSRAERERLPGLLDYLEAIALWTIETELAERRRDEVAPPPALPRLGGGAAMAAGVLRSLARSERVQAAVRSEVAAFLEQLAGELEEAARS